MTFVHVRGHTREEGNERADRLVQWGKTAGPYTRLSRGGAREGLGLGGRVEGHLRKTAVAGGELLTELVLGGGDDDEFVQLAGEADDVVAGEADDVVAGEDVAYAEDEPAAVTQISLDSEEVVLNSGLEAV